MTEKRTKKNNGEKDRPPRYAGESDAALERARHRRDDPAPERPGLGRPEPGRLETDPIEPRRDTGIVTMPEHDFDPWADPMTRPKGRDG